MTATTAYYSGDVPGLAGKAHYGGGGRGTLGSLIPSSGDHGPSYLYASLSLPADADKEYYGVLGAQPANLTSFSADENGAVTAAANDGTYRYPFDLYENGTLLGSTYFDMAFGQVVDQTPAASQTVTLTGTGSTQGNASSVGVATITPLPIAPHTAPPNFASTAHARARHRGRR